MNIPPAATTQYNRYRLTPNEFPSYDRLRFVRLKDDLLPRSLKSDDTSKNTDNNNVLYHPILLYHSIPQYIKDTPLDFKTKHGLIMEWRKCGGDDVCVGRLLGWSQSVESGNNEEMYFPSPSADLIRLPKCHASESSLSNTDSDRRPDILSFYEHLEEFERACRQLEQRRDIEIRDYCAKWRKGVHFGLNLVGMDLGEEVLPWKSSLENLKSNDQKNDAKSVNEGTVQISMESPVKMTSNKNQKKRKALGDIGNTSKRVDVIQPTKSTIVKSTKLQIDPQTPWPILWKTLRSHGWNWKGGTGLMTDYYYIRPGKKIKSGIVNVDYFVKVEDVQDFCRKEYGWIGEAKVSPDVVEKTDSSAFKQVAVDASSSQAEIPPSDLEIPPLHSPLDPHLSWRTAWDILLSSGWDWKHGSGLMTDYYYLKPGKKVKTSVEGVDYFVDRASLEGFMKRCYGWIGEVESAKKKESMKCEESGKKKKTKSTNKVKVEKRESLDFEDDEAQTNKKPKLSKMKVEKIKSKSPKSVQIKDEAPVHETPCFIADWKELWPQLKNEGWDVRKAGKYNRLHDWYWVRPGCDPADEETKLGKHYFTSEEDVMNYVASQKSIDDSVDAAVKSSSSSSSKSPKSSQVKDETPIDNTPCFIADWKELWPQLKNEGWDVRKAGKYNRLHDWYWVRPGCDPADEVTKLGEHYFISEEGVMNYVISRKNNNSTPLPTSNMAQNDSSTSEWNVLWSQLKSEGWTVEESGRNKLWVRPWVDLSSPTAHLGKDYFQSQKEVMHFVQGNTTSERSLVEQTHAMKVQAVRTHVAEWKELWPELKLMGWTVQKAGKYNRLHGWYWIRPGYDPADENTKLGKHYFTSEEDVMDFVKKQSSEGNASEDIVEEAVSQCVARNDTPKRIKSNSNETTQSNQINDNTEQTPVGCTTRPQDPAIPLPPSPESSVDSEGNDDHAWGNLWPRLQLAGWKCIKAGKINKLHDFYYVRPQRDPADPECVLGKHYFVSRDDVIQFEKMRDENEGKNKLERTSLDVMQGLFEKETEETGL